MVTNKILPKIIGSDTTKKILQEVDDIIVKGKVDKNPEKLLSSPKKKVKIDGKEVEVDRSEATEVELKKYKKAKQPKVSKETEQEFLKVGDLEKGRKVQLYLKDFNIKNINTNDDIYRLINAVSKSTAKSIDKQKRGVRTQAATKGAATRLQNDADFLVDVLGKKAGDTYNAEQILAIRELLVAGKNRLFYLANKAQDPINSTADDILKFRQHFALMAQIQKVLKGVQTETARALQQFRIPTRTKQSFIGGNIDDLNKESLIVELGGVDEIRQIAKLYVGSPAGDAAKLKAIEKTGLSFYNKNIKRYCRGFYKCNFIKSSNSR